MGVTAEAGTGSLDRDRSPRSYIRAETQPQTTAFELLGMPGEDSQFTCAGSTCQNAQDLPLLHPLPS